MLVPRGMLFNKANTDIECDRIPFAAESHPTEFGCG